METKSQNLIGFFRAAAVFVLGLSALWLFPLSRLSMFPYDLLAMKDSQHGWHHVLSHPQATMLAVLQWTVATAIFAALARKARFVLLAPLALGAFTFFTVATHFAIHSLGMDLYRDLWH